MSVWNDVCLAVRLLTRDRAFTLTAAAVLALGIAANGLGFTLLNGVLLRDLPYQEPNRLVAIESRDTRNSGNNSSLSYLDFKDLQASARAFSSIAGGDQRPMHIADRVGAAERVIGAYVSANTF